MVINAQLMIANKNSVINKNKFNLFGVEVMCVQFYYYYYWGFFGVVVICV
jgi:hypothetical protein